MMTDEGLGLAAGDQAPLIIKDGVCTTRGELRARSDALVDSLRQHSVRRALVCSDDTIDILRALDACSRAGVDLYIAHTNIPADYIAGILESFSIQMKIGERDELNHVAAAADSRARVFMMTSGTTGRPKIAAHTLESLLSRVRAGAKFAANRGARWLLPYQPTGFAGVQVTLTAVLTRGVVVSPTQRTPAGFYSAACAAQVSQISATPTFWRAFLMLVKPGDLHLQQITLGGEAADQVTLDRLAKMFPEARITHTYASTEAGMVYAVHDRKEGFPSAWLDHPNQGIQLRIRDGFLHIRTRNAMRGYITESNQPIQEDGWLVTADRCEIRGDRAFILGREDSTINVGGSKAYPLAVEQFLLTLPGVIEARVYGVPNPISGFLVAADVVLTKDADKDAARSAILAACREKLAGYQVPRVFRIVDAISVGASGKKG